MTKYWKLPPSRVKPNFLPLRSSGLLISGLAKILWVRVFLALAMKTNSVTPCVKTRMIDSAPVMATSPSPLSIAAVTMTPEEYKRVESPDHISETGQPPRQSTALIETSYEPSE